MARVVASVEIDAPVETVWRHLEPIEDHADWMADAERIDFETEQRRDVGTRFIAHTKVGPIRLADRMEITVWRPHEAMGVRHVGVVSGVGEFTLVPIDDRRRTRMVWDERLDFPWYLGGPAGGVVGGRVVLAQIWRRNLARFRDLVEAGRCES